MGSDLQGACDMSAVCLDCPDRMVVCTDEFKYNCHDHCERYAEEVRLHREEQAKRLNGKLKENAYMDYVAEKNKRLRKRKG